MKTVWLELSNETKAQELAQKAFDYRKLSKNYEDGTLQVIELYELKYYVEMPTDVDYSDYVDDVDNSHSKHPKDVVFASGLQENYDREEDGRNVVKVLVTMLDSGLGGVPQSGIAALFKEMGWVRSMLKEGFFETAYWEHTQVFTPKGLLPAESLEGIRLQILQLAIKYNPSFDGTVS